MTLIDRHIQIAKWMPLILAGILFAVSCRHEKCSLYDNFGVPIYEPEYAVGYEIKGSEDGNSELIRTFVPWQGAENDTTDLLILHKGAMAPDGFEGQVIREYAKRIVCMSSTHVAMLDALGLSDRIAGVSRKEFINNEYVRQHESEIADVGFVGEMDFESLVAADPDIVLLYGMFGASPDEAKLRQLGIPFIYIGDYIEESPLGKAEWLIALAEIAGVIDKGKKEFADIPVRYDEVRKRVPPLSGASRPQVMINAPYGDAWFMSPKGSYLASMVHDAGASYVFDHETGTEAVKISMEDALRLLSKSDFWLNAGDVDSVSDLQSMYPKLADVSCVRNGNVYNNTLRTPEGGGNDYYESGVLHPDLILSDLIRIFHPEVTTDAEFHYFKRLKR